MSYQTLQPSLAWTVIPSDDAEIPNISQAGPTGTTNADGTSNNLLVDTTKNFVELGVRVGMVVVNTADSRMAYVGGFATNTNPNDSILLVDGSGAVVTGFAELKVYEIYGGDQRGAVLYVGGAGDVAVVTAAGSEVTFSAVPAGSFMPIQVSQVKDTGTTATLMVAMW